MSESKCYKIVCLTVSGKGKKVFRNGDVVSETELLDNAIVGLLKSGAIKEATKKDVDESKKLGQMSETEKIAEKAKKAEEAEAAAQKELNAVREAYSKLTGISVDKINKTWGIHKLEKEIEAIKAEKAAEK